MPPTILTLPGLNNSGAEHWQTHWEAVLPNVMRVQQKEWDLPQRADWVAALDAKLAAVDGPVILVAHSLGCVLTAWWSAQHGHAAHAGKVAGALLVAPADVERQGFPTGATGFSPMPRFRLPFKSIVLASSDDAWCASSRAASFAVDWGAQFHDIGACGHINANSRLGAWPLGQAYLSALMEIK